MHCIARLFCACGGAARLRVVLWLCTARSPTSLFILGVWDFVCVWCVSLHLQPPTWCKRWRVPVLSPSSLLATSPSMRYAPVAVVPALRLVAVVFNALLCTSHLNVVVFCCPSTGVADRCCSRCALLSCDCSCRPAFWTTCWTPPTRRSWLTYLRTMLSPATSRHPS